MILKNKIFSVSLAFLLSASLAFAAVPSLTSAHYSPNNNQLALTFDDSVKLDAILLGLISFDDDDGGPNADIVLQGGKIVNPTAQTMGLQVIVDLVYGDIIDSFTGEYFGEGAFLFELWGNNVQQIKSIEAMATSNLQLHVASGAFVSKTNEPTGAQSITCGVSAADVKPEIQSAVYDANVNTLTFTFDSDVQFDVIAEDRSVDGGPGNGILDTPISGQFDGEDRNGNDSLDYEANIRPFQIGLVSDAGSMTLENIGSVMQTTDNDTIDIELTGNDAKRLESSIGYSNLHLDVQEWAFVDGLYNPNLPSDAVVEVIPDSVNFVADSASYNYSKNILSIYFSNVMHAGRTITLTNPSPVYTKIHLTSSVGTYTLNGVEGNPSSIGGFDNTAFKFKLPIFDQAGLEPLLEGDGLTLSMNSFALYDNLNNGNAEFADVPVRVEASPLANEQPPVLIASTYDVDNHTVTLTWDLNLGVGFYDGEALTVLDDAEYQELMGITLYDSVADSTLSLGEGKIYYSGSKKNTYIELAQSDAIFLETYPNLESLGTYLDRDVFNAFLFLNGNAPISVADSISFDIIPDTTAPDIESVRLNVFTKIVEISVDEPVAYAGLNPASFNLAGVVLAGSVLNEMETLYSPEIEIEIDDATFTALTALPDSVFIAPDMIAAASSVTNITGDVSLVDTIRTSIGRTFYMRSFEAFAPAPALRFGALKLIGEHVDIYVDDEMWAEEKISADNLLELQAAFETSTPVDSLRGIKAIVDEYYGGILDTDGNGKLVLFLADLQDEYDLGRNDTDDSFYENGYTTLSDTTDGQYSNQSDMIYLDVDPQILGEAPYTEWDESMLNALTYQYALLSAMSRRPDQERWINYGIALKLQEQTVGDIKFFGDGSAALTTSTANNELTYIAESLLKSRYDLFNVYNYFTYLTEKYSTPGDSLAILQEIAGTDVVGVDAIDSALVELGIDVSAAQTYQNYAVACFLDLTQYHVEYDTSGTIIAQDSAKYGGLYNFAALELDGAPGGKNAGNLPWDKAAGNGAPFARKSIQPWSFNFYVARSYFIDIEGNFNIVSPDLNGSDTLVFDGYDGINFQASKILLHSGYLDAMTRDFEVVDFELDPETSRGQLPLTTDPMFEFRTTNPDTANGVQLLAIVVAKTDYAQAPVTYDYVLTNVTTKPEFGDFYAMQNPDVNNYLDLFVVSERPIYGLTGVEEASAQVNGLIDTVTVDLPLLDASDGIVSVYSGKYLLSAEGAYSIVFSGRDQNGVSLDPVTRNISVGMAKPTTQLAMALPNNLGDLNIPAQAVSSAKYVVAGEYSTRMSSQILTQSDLPSGVNAISDVFYVGRDEMFLNEEATLALSLNSLGPIGGENLGVYVLQEDEWRFIGGYLNATDRVLEVTTGQLGRFVIASGNHPQGELSIPKVFSLEQNFPNPFNPSTTIAFSVPRHEQVTVRIFNMLGQEILTLADGYYSEGRHELHWNSRDASQVRVASGVYFYTVESADSRLVKKMLLLK